MNESLKKHLDGITEENYVEFFKTDGFLAFASATSKNGFVELGMQNGSYAVRKDKNVVYYHDTPTDAIKGYRHILTKENHYSDMA